MGANVAEMMASISTARDESIPQLAERLVHKLRNPLSVITVAASQLDVSAGELLAKDDLAFIRDIIVASENMESILTRFLWYANPPRPQFNDFDLNEICRNQAAEYNQKYSDDSGAEGKVRFLPGSVSINVTCDRQMMQIVISELLENALRSTKGKPGQMITVRTDRSENSACIIIDDTGDGINESSISSLFLPFITQRPGATGLGLSISERLVSLHGGKISLTARPEGGARVTVIIPKTQETIGHAVNLDCR